MLAQKPAFLLSEETRELVALVNDTEIASKAGESRNVRRWSPRRQLLTRNWPRRQRHTYEV